MFTFVSSLFSHPTSTDKPATQLVYALFRIYCGISIAIGAGLSKVFHKIDEAGDKSWDNLAFGAPQWFIDQVHDIGFTLCSPTIWAYLAVYGEFIGGLLIAVGLWTRISAIQLAFQFFVVSFIWYKEPMLFSMYYQQLIFWGFVLIAAFGGGKYSIDAWLAGRKAAVRAKSVKPATATATLLLGIGGFCNSAQAQSAEPICFSIVNTEFKEKNVDIRYFDSNAQTSRGYGYDLGPLASHAVRMPVGTRVYHIKNETRELAFVVNTSDNGRTFDASRIYPVNEAQRAKVALDEQNEAAWRLGKEQKDQPAFSENTIQLKISGKHLDRRAVHVRVQLPNDPGKTNLGFTQNLNRFDELQVAYPIGAKIYLCDGPYWKQPVTEKLILEVTEAQNNQLIRL